MSGQVLPGFVSVLLADNPGAMTLEGTNTWILQTPGHGESPSGTSHTGATQTGDGSAPRGTVVVDPGPDLCEHIDAVAASGPVELILITHRHGDHTDAIDGLHQRTGASVRAYLSEYCRDAQPLQGGEILNAAGLRIQVMHTPGHTSDSLCFVVTHTQDDGGARTLVLTGDTVLGRGTTMIDHPDGTLADYLETLDRLEALAAAPGTVVGLPGHGEVLDDLAEACVQLREHRLARLREIQAAMRSLGVDATVEELTDHIYPEVPQGARHAAVRAIEAQMAYLAEPPKTVE